MSLNKIRKANKKWKHEHDRRKKQEAKRAAAERDKKILRARRKKAVEERQARLNRRQAELSYVDKLTEEIQ